MKYQKYCVARNNDIVFIFNQMEQERFMKLKYKRMITLLTTCIMGVGMVMFSITQQNKTKTDDDKLSKNAMATANSSGDEDNSSSTLTAPTVTVTVAPTATPTPSNDLLLNKFADINEVVAAFYNAKLTCSEEDFAPILMNADQLDMDRLQRKIEYVKSYQNINCYTKEGINEIDYVVFVSYDLELTTIETYAPSIDELRITYVDGKPRIYMGDISEETSNYLKELRSGEDVQVLVSDVISRLEEACAIDENLNEFYQNIKNSTSESNSNSKSASSSD